MKDKTPAFLISYTPYQEEAALLYFLTEEGVIALYDGFLMRKPYSGLRHQSEHLFAITTIPAPLNPDYHYLKSWEILTPYELSPERMSLWHGLLGVARYSQGYDHAPMLFQFYKQTLDSMSNPLVPIEKIYFSAVYIFLQILMSLGVGDFTYHYERIWKRLKLSEDFHQKFLKEGQIAASDFTIVIEYLSEALQDVFRCAQLFPYLQIFLRDS